MPNANSTPPSKPFPKKDRLEELLALAQTYRGWTLRELAETLGRDPHKLVPESGVPKLDLVIRLAEVLDWSVDQVARDLCGDASGTESSEESSSFSALDEAAFEAYEAGRFDDVERIAQLAFRAARTADERARAITRQIAACDALGLHAQALEHAQRGLREVTASREYHLSFRANLANAHYTLGNIYEAEALANSLVEWFSSNPLPNPHSQSTKAVAYYVRGSCHRCFAGSALPTSLQNGQWHAQRAHEDLSTSQRLFEEHAARTGRETYAGYANVCRGAVLEVAPLVGVTSPEEVLDTIMAGLDDVVNPQEMPQGPWLESLGWWCIFGCNVAMRHIADPERLQTLMAVFTNKADEIAERLGNWALRERVWTMELERRRRAEGEQAAAEDWVMDADDVRIVAGTMARFPVFREVGWQVLRSARRVNQ